ncbi:MAG TPA: hypothetical protein VF944_10900 [Candidatus Bathyarchaeia archaeon]
MKPRSVIMVAFATGSITIQSAKSPDELRAQMNERDFDDNENAIEIRINSISETEVKSNPRDTDPAYILKNEEIHFRKKDVVFWSISEAFDPPRVKAAGGGLVKI